MRPIIAKSTFSCAEAIGDISTHSNNASTCFFILTLSRDEMNGLCRTYAAWIKLVRNKIASADFCRKCYFTKNSHLFGGWYDAKPKLIGHFQDVTYRERPAV